MTHPHGTPGSKAWLDETLSGSEEVGFAWVVLLAVLRLTTKPAVFARPLRAGEAFDIIDEWLAQPCALVLHPTTRHAALMRGFLTAAWHGREPDDGRAPGCPLR